MKTNNNDMPQGRYVDVPVLLERWDMRAFELASIARRHGVDLFSPLGSLFDFSLLDELNAYDQKVIHGDILQRSLLRTDAIRLEKEARLLSAEETPQLPPPPIPQAKVEQDDAHINSRRKTTYLKLLYVFLKKAGVFNEEQRNRTSKVKTILEREGFSLDPKVIREVLEELEEVSSIKREIK